MINILATITAAASAFLLGGIWYSPKCFLNIWLRESGMTETSYKEKSHGAKVFIVSFLLSLVSALGFALFLGSGYSLTDALAKAFIVGILWVGTSFGINYGFAAKSFKLFLIDAGYHFFQFILYALVFGFWPH